MEKQQKLKIITLIGIPRSLGLTIDYKAVENGRVLVSRSASLASNKMPYIGALITKNINHKFPYSLFLFTSFERIIKPGNKRCRPYALALIEGVSTPNW